MRADTSILLIEGDPRTTAQFIPYGAQQQQEAAGYSPYHQTIEDEDSLYLFFDRELLNGMGCVFHVAIDL